ncbi:metallopeptidase [Saccharomonospora sp. NPDC006951]
MTITDSREGVRPLPAAFRTAWLGYHRADVRRYSERVEEVLRLVTADRDAAADCAERLARALEELRNENDELRARLDRVCAEPIESDGLSERLLHMVELAHEEADEIVERAREDAERTAAAANRAATRLRARHEQQLVELAERARQREAEHDELLRQVRQEAEERAEAEAREAREAERRRRELDEQATRRRQELDRDFATSMAARREEAQRAIDERADAARSEADSLVNEARETAQRQVAEAEAEVRRLREVRGQISDELRSAREVLAKMVSLTEPLPEEDELARPALPRQRAHPEPAGAG